MTLLFASSKEPFEPFTMKNPPEMKPATRAKLVSDRPALAPLTFGQTSLPLACAQCRSLDLTRQLNNGYVSCNRCFSVRSETAWAPEFEREWQNLIAMFATWRDAYTADDTSALAIEATTALAWRLGACGITIGADELLALPIAEQIDALAPRLMLMPKPVPEREPLKAPVKVADAHFGSRVTESSPGAPEYIDPSDDAAITAIMDAARQKLALEAMRDGLAYGVVEMLADGSTIVHATVRATARVPPAEPKSTDLLAILRS